MTRQSDNSSKKQTILQLAFDRFYDGGFHATGVDTVMADTGISKRTLYKYFPSKDDLIDAVLDRYGETIVAELFEPVLQSSDDAAVRIMTLFDVRKEMLDSEPLRGCLGLKAAQEYSGKSGGIAEHGKRFGLYVENELIEICRQGRLPNAESLGKQLTIVFQGAVVLSQVYGDTGPFADAKETAALLLRNAQSERPPAPRFELRQQQALGPAHQRGILVEKAG
jgi:AcrR family transcriptional regulator